MKKELKTTIKKQKGLKIEKKTENVIDREGKFSVNIRTADGTPIKKFIDEKTKLKEAMKSLLDSDGNSVYSMMLPYISVYLCNVQRCYYFA